MKSALLVVAGMILMAAVFGGAKYMGTSSAPAAYEPTASEVPLTVDFEVAAEKRVQPDNYKVELKRVENELLQLSREQ